MALLIQHGDHAHADAVLADLERVRGTPRGLALVDALTATPVRVRIGPPEPVYPPNAWVRQGGEDCDWSLTYDPREWPSEAYGAVLPSDQILVRLLRVVARRLADAGR